MTDINISALPEVTGTLNPNAKMLYDDGTTTSIVKMSTIAANFPAGPDGPPGPVTYKSLVFVINGNGSLIAPGTYALGKAGFGGTIVGWEVVTDLSTTASIDVFKSSNGGGIPTTSICGSALPTLSSALENSSTTLTGWTTLTVVEKDNLILNLASNSAAKYLQLTLKVQASS